MYTAEHDRNPVIFNELASDMYQLLPVNQRDAYTTLIRSVYDAQRHMFVDMNALLESWKIWDPILQGDSDIVIRVIAKLIDACLARRLLDCAP